MKKFLSLIAVILVAATTSFGQGLAKYSGDFSIASSTGPHKTEMKGVMSLLFDNSQMVSLKMVTTAAVFGKTEFVSSEQWFNYVEVNAVPQISVVFKLQATPHKWYYVYVANLVDGKYSGTFYKSTETMDKIQSSLKPGLTVVPATWSSKGAGNITQLNF